jgi:predicted type IV restriction endonuclease
VPEFTADVGTKKGEKVDYAIIRNGKPTILIECKKAGEPLGVEHASQLYRYFSVVEARIAILTDGIIYQLYSDIEQPNIMDAKPFLTFDLRELREEIVAELHRLSREEFDLDQMLTAASELKYTGEIHRILSAQLQEPDEEFVRYFAGQVYSGRLTSAVREQFRPIVKKALSQFISERVSSRLRFALDEERQSMRPPREDHEPASTNPQNDDQDDGIVTTPDEWEGYYLVKTILREDIDAGRIAIRDTLSYCGILLDDNNRKPICRLHFNRAQKYLGLFDQQKKEERIAIETVDDIYKYAQRLKETIRLYEQAGAAAPVS